MTDSGKGRAPILAAGGIVIRNTSRPLIAVVRQRREKAWVLPKGKLKPDEAALSAARRETEEETGHDVSVHEFLGTMSYTAEGRIKIVQFWRMQVLGGPVREPMPDIKAVKWLPLKKAIEILTREHERVFLENVGPVAVKAAKLSAMTPARRHVRRRFPLADAVRGWIGAMRSPKGEARRMG